MQNLIRGQKIRLPEPPASCTVGICLRFPAGIVSDLSCFGVDAQDQLTDDRYFIFFNQKSSPEGAMRSLGAGEGMDERFAIDLSQLPQSIRKLVFTCNIDGEGSMQQLQEIRLQLKCGNEVFAELSLSGSDFQQEKALILGELYCKDAWRFNAVGQGFAGGLPALLQHFGGKEAAPAPKPPKIDLMKRVEEKAPALVSLVKQARVSLDKTGLRDHRAKVALCLDISGSMLLLYKSGQVQAFAERILALACLFDDDGSIDVFLFGAVAHNVGAMSLDNFHGFIAELREKYPLESRTQYGKAIEMIRRFYFPDVPTRMSNNQMDNKTPTQADLPVYVMFVTDGSTDDKDFSQRQIRMASYEPIFWQFMTIGGGQFEFLQQIDTMTDRYIDNASFFNVAEPKQLPDGELYERLVGEYPGWVEKAKRQGLLR